MPIVSGNNNEPLKVLVAAGHGEFCQVYQLSLQRSVSYISLIKFIIKVSCSGRGERVLKRQGRV